MEASSPPIWEFATIVLCVLLSGYFSGSEISIASLSRAKVHALVEGRSRRHPLAIWQRDPSGLLTAILIGNNLVNIGASALATDIASRYFEHQAVAVAVGVMTLVILVFGEISPKVTARRFAEPFALKATWPLAFFYYLTWPVGRLFAVLTRTLLRLTGEDPSQDFSSIEAEELRWLVALAAREGGLERYPAHLIERIFKFRERRVKDAMVPRTEMVALDMSDGVEGIFETARGSAHSRLPVYRDSLDEIIGVFHVKDLLTGDRACWDAFILTDHLHPPYFVPESAPLVAVLREFQKRRIHLGIVVDEFGGTEGIITLEDILEELVGEIFDEFDRPIVMIRPLPAGAVDVSGRTPIEDLVKAFPDWRTDLPAKTVGGLIMEITGKVPSSGETVTEGRLRFTVVSANDRQIKRVKVEPLAEDSRTR